MIIQFKLGDIFNDGHGKYDTHTIESNLTALEIEKAYRKSSVVYGWNFDKVAQDYEDSTLPEDIAKKMESLGYEFECDLDEYYLDDSYYIEGTEEFLAFILWFVKLSRPDFEYSIIRLDYVDIGNLGYGLFY